MGVQGVLALIALVGLAGGGGVLWGALKSARSEAAFAQVKLANAEANAGALRVANAGLAASLNATRHSIEAAAAEAERRDALFAGDRARADRAATDLAIAARTVALRPALPSSDCVARVERLALDADGVMRALTGAVLDAEKRP